MCFVNQLICSGCKTITEIPTPRKPCALTPDVLQYGCNGKKVVVETERTGPEFCSNCYNKRHVEIEKKWERKARAFAKEAEKQGYTPVEVESLSQSFTEDMKKEMMMLDQEWENMWTA